MTIKKDLMAFKKDLTAIGKKLETLIKAVEKSETKVILITPVTFSPATLV